MRPTASTARPDWDFDTASGGILVVSGSWQMHFTCRAPVGSAWVLAFDVEASD
jgi:hypothetical protein